MLNKWMHRLHTSGAYWVSHIRLCLLWLFRFHHESCGSKTVFALHYKCIRSELLEKQRQVAMITEMTHCCSLIHDDVIDASDSRRGRPSVNVLWNHRRVSISLIIILFEIWRSVVRWTKTVADARCQIKYNVVVLCSITLTWRRKAKERLKCSECALFVIQS